MGATLREPSYIDSARLYSLRGFVAASGVSETRIREARRMGIVLPRIECGRRHFIRGADGIGFIEALAAHEAGRAAVGQAL